MSEKTSNTISISINTKVTLLIITMIMLSSFFVGIFSYLTYRSDCIRYKEETTLSVTESVASIIDGDELYKIIETGQKTEYYYQIQPVFE